MKLIASDFNIYGCYDSINDRSYYIGVMDIIEQMILKGIDPKCIGIVNCHQYDRPSDIVPRKYIFYVLDEAYNAVRFSYLYPESIHISPNIFGHPNIFSYQISEGGRIGRNQGVDLKRKIYDISFIGNTALKPRLGIRQLMEELYQVHGYCTYINDSGNIPFEEYIDIVRKSKYVLSPMGSYLCSRRTTEAIKVDSIPIIDFDMNPELKPFTLNEPFSTESVINFMDTYGDKLIELHQLDGYISKYSAQMTDVDRVKTKLEPINIAQSIIDAGLFRSKSVPTLSTIDLSNIKHETLVEAECAWLSKRPYLIRSSKLLPQYIRRLMIQLPIDGVFHIPRSPEKVLSTFDDICRSIVVVDDPMTISSDYMQFFIDDSHPKCIHYKLI